MYMHTSSALIWKGGGGGKGLFLPLVSVALIPRLFLAVESRPLDDFFAEHALKQLAEGQDRQLVVARQLAGEVLHVDDIRLREEPRMRARSSALVLVSVSPAQPLPLQSFDSSSTAALTASCASGSTPSPSSSECGGALRQCKSGMSKKSSVGAG